MSRKRHSLRDELLNGEIFYTLREAQIVVESPRGRLRHADRLRRPRWRYRQLSTNIPPGRLNVGRSHATPDSQNFSFALHRSFGSGLRGTVAIARRLPDFQLGMQPAHFLFDQIDVHRLLAGFSAQFVKVEVATVNTDMGHWLDPDAS